MNSEDREYIVEIHQNYNDLGEDLLMLEAVLTAVEGGLEFPGEYVDSSLERLREYACQHFGEIDQLMKYLILHSVKQRRTTADWNPS